MVRVIFLGEFCCCSEVCRICYTTGWTETEAYSYPQTVSSHLL